MTPRQTRFVAEYLIDLNATQAAIRAGYSARTANEQGARLLANVSVAAEVQKAMDKRANKLEITAERVLQEFAKVAFANMLDYVKVEAGAARIDFTDMTREQAAVIQSIETEERMDRTGEVDEDGKPTFERIKKTKFRLHDKLSALTSLGRHLKVFEGEEGSGDQLDRLVAALKREPYQPAPRVN